MEFEQIVKRLEWLDEERRKDKAAIAALQERQAALEGSLDAAEKRAKKLSGDLSKFSSTAARVDQFDQAVEKLRGDVNKLIEALENRLKRREREAQKRLRDEDEGLNTALADLSKEVAGIQRGFSARLQEETRLQSAISEMETRVGEVLEKNEDVLRQQRLVEENHRQDLKRISDLAGEVAALRKRTDEYRQKTDLNADNTRLLDGRINELLASETERRQSQAQFLEQQARAQVERDRAWKEWRDRYDSFIKQTEALEAQLQTLEATHRAVKRSQETHNELNQRLERRINEITEMQRLAEDRIRQEWVAFKADDQKRWTTYNLSFEEQQRDLREDLKALSDQVTALGDSLQTQADMFQQTTETTGQKLQELMSLAHEWLSASERIMGRSRPR
jgi:chromosome segregation ATPase